MKMFDKIRDLFTEEVEVETPVKKEVIQVEIPAPETKKEVPEAIIPTEEKPEVRQAVRPEVKPVVKPVVKPQEDKFNFPVFFDEKDFEDEPRPEPKPVVKQEVKRNAYGVKKEVKEEKKKFAPTPIISPVYGVLDKNYKKDDIVDKPKKVSYSVDTNMTIDDVRNKAYGTLEDELESTLFGKTSIMFANKDEQNDSYTDIEDDLKETADALDLLREDHDVVSKTEVEATITTEEKPKHKKATAVQTKSRVESLDDILNGDFMNEEKEPKKDDTDDLDVVEDTTEESIEESIEEPAKEEVTENTNMVEDVLNNDLVSDDKLSESDLFNLIDNMYEKGDK